MIIVERLDTDDFMFSRCFHKITICNVYVHLKKYQVLVLILHFLFSFRLILFVFLAKYSLHFPFYLHLQLFVSFVLI